MQIYHAPTTRRSMEAIYILRDDTGHPAPCFARGKLTMCPIGTSLTKLWVANLRPCPVTLAPSQVLNKVFVLHRGTPFPFTVLVTIVPDT